MVGHVGCFVLRVGSRSSCTNSRPHRGQSWRPAQWLFLPEVLPAALGRSQFPNPMVLCALGRYSTPTLQQMLHLSFLIRSQRTRHKWETLGYSNAVPAPFGELTVWWRSWHNQKPSSPARRRKISWDFHSLHCATCFVSTNYSPTGEGLGVLSLEIVKPLWKTVWLFLRELDITSPFRRAIPLLETHTQKNWKPVSAQKHIHNGS